MSDPASAGPVDVHATLDAVALARPFDQEAYALTWEISITGIGLPALYELPCGVAALRPPGSELRAEFDYRSPGTLRRVLVPFGTVDVPEDADDVWGVLLEGGRLSPLDAAVLRLLVGDLVDDLDGARDHRVTLAPPTSWQRLGDVALAQTVLERGARPLDGLWALELATIVRGLGAGGELAAWADDWRRSVVPALAYVDESWQAWLGDETQGRLLTLLTSAKDAGVPESDLGPLYARLNGQAVAALAEAVGEALRDSWVGDDLAASGLRLGAPTLGAGEPAVEPRPAILGEAAARYGLRNARYAVDAGEVVITVDHAAVVPTSLAQRVAIRVTTRDGVLVASGSALHDGGRSLEARLRVPRGTTADSVTVVIDRQLPLTPVTDRAFEQLNEVRRNRDAADGERIARGHFVCEAIRRDFDRNLGELRLGASAEHDTTAQLAAKRSICLVVGNDALAAGFEFERLRRRDHADPLTVEQLDNLALAAARAGYDLVAKALADAALDELYADD